MSRFSIAGLSLLLMLAAVACETKPGAANIPYERNSSNLPPTRTADKAGYYALFPGDGVTPLDGSSVYLHLGDAYGFQMEDGKVVGFFTTRPAPSQDVITKTIPLDSILTTQYLWKYQGEKQP